MIIIYLFVLIIIAFIISILVWMYVFSVYEVLYEIDASKLTDNSHIVTVLCKPINSFGKKSPFRIGNYMLEITSGNENVKSINYLNNKIEIILSTSDKITLEGIITSSFSLFPHKFRIN
jgi:ABC-type polar amino acid transport system ATPase subunit